MEKNKCYIFAIIISISVFIGVFYYSVLNTSAGQSAGDEVYFTHTHLNSCYQEVAMSCSGTHTCRHEHQYADYHCSSCGRTTRHNVEADNCYCPAQNISWQENGFTRCTICGTIHSTWGGQAGLHIVMAKQLVCTIPEGERTAGVRITAENDWTNQGVLLQVETNILKQDITNNSISYGWGGTEKLVEENGTYTVDAVNTAGQTVTASISVSCIDKISPVINSITGDTDNMTQTSISVSVNASDGESGLSETAWSFDGGNTFENNQQTTVIEGTDVVCVVRDKVGNTTSKTVKRSDFPYPPPPPPATVEPSVPATSSPSANFGMPSGTTTVKADSKVALPQDQRDSSVDQNTVKTGTKNSERKRQGGSDQDTVKKSKENSTNKKKAEPVSGIGYSEAEMKFVPESKYRMEDGPTQSEDKKYNESGKNEGKVTIYRKKDGGEVPTKAAVEIMEEGDSFTENENQHITEADTAKSVWSNPFSLYLERYEVKAAGVLLIAFCMLWIIRKKWIQTVFLYCYNGGEEFRKLGLLHLKKNKKEFTLFLPDELLDEAETPRYRLLVHRRLVKKYDRMDLVLQSEDHKLRQPLEECVDFVL